MKSLHNEVVDNIRANLQEQFFALMHKNNQDWDNMLNRVLRYVENTVLRYIWDNINSPMWYRIYGELLLNNEEQMEPFNDKSS